MDKLLNATIQSIAQGNIKNQIWFATSGGLLFGNLITDSDQAIEKIFLTKSDGKIRENQQVSHLETPEEAMLIFLENAKIIILGQSINLGTAVINENQIAAWGVGVTFSEIHPQQPPPILG